MRLESSDAESFRSSRASCTSHDAVQASACLQALQTLMQRQAVDYDFEYYTLPQPASTAVTVLSAGPSLFKDAVDVLLPLAPQQPLGAPPLQPHASHRLVGAATP